MSNRSYSLDSIGGEVMLHVVGTPVSVAIGVGPGSQLVGQVILSQAQAAALANEVTQLAEAAAEGTPGSDAEPIWRLAEKWTRSGRAPYATPI